MSFTCCSRPQCTRDLPASKVFRLLGTLVPYDDIIKSCNVFLAQRLLQTFPISF